MVCVLKWSPKVNDFWPVFDIFGSFFETILTIQNVRYLWGFWPKMNPKNNQKNDQKWLQILSKKMIKKMIKKWSKNVPKKWPKMGTQNWFFWDLSRILKKWNQIDGLPRVLWWSVGRPVDWHLWPHYFLQTHASRAIRHAVKIDGSRFMVDRI